MKRTVTFLLLLCMIFGAVSTNITAFAVNEEYTNVYFHGINKTDDEFNTIHIELLNPKEGLRYSYEINRVNVMFEETIAGAIKNGTYYMTVKAWLLDEYFVLNADGSAIKNEVIADGKDLVFNFALHKKPVEEKEESETPIWDEEITVEPEKPSVDMTRAEEGNVQANELYTAFRDCLYELVETNAEEYHKWIEDFKDLSNIHYVNWLDNGRELGNHFRDRIKDFSGLEAQLYDITTAKLFWQLSAYIKNKNNYEFFQEHAYGIIYRDEDEVFLPEDIKEAYKNLANWAWEYYHNVDTTDHNNCFDFQLNEEVLKNKENILDEPIFGDDESEEISTEESASGVSSESVSDEITSEISVVPTVDEDDDKDKDDEEAGIWDGVLDVLEDNIITLAILAILIIAILVIREYKKRKAIDDD